MNIKNFNKNLTISVFNVFSPQYIYLDFDGALTAYNGEILTVDEVSVSNSNITKDEINDIINISTYFYVKRKGVE